MSGPQPSPHLDLDRLADLLAGEGSDDDVAHVGQCSGCAGRLDELSVAEVEVAAALAALPAPPLPADLADRLTAALPDGGYVADAPYFMHGRSQRDAEQAADALRRGAASRELEPVALQATMRAQGWQAMFTQFAADWFHPNDRGHRVWADAFWQKISRDVQDLERRPR